MVPNITVQDYGSWQSPITEEVAAGSSLRLADLSVHNGQIFWIEGRATEKGRSVLVCYADGQKKDCVPAECNVRSRVHEYGGLCYVLHDGIVYFVNFANQHIQKITKEGAIETVFGEAGKRFAHLVTSIDGKYLYSVMEDHTDPTLVKNSLIRIDLLHKKLDIIASGYDFYAEPTLSPNGKHLAFIAWNHPDMPWDSTDLFLSDINAHGTPTSPKKIAGKKDVSILGLNFSKMNRLYYASDESGFWNFYSFDGLSVSPLCPMQADVAEPMWVLGIKRSDFVLYKGKYSLACIYTEEGVDRLGIINLEDSSLETIDIPFTGLQSLRSYRDGVVFIGASPTSVPSVVYLDFKTGAITTLFESQKISIDLKFFSIPFPIKYKTTHDQEAHAIYYPPCNPHFQSGENQKTPPLIVRCHGGPTAHKKPVLDLTQQYWTTRGFAVVDVNYRGSSGYGRDYRRLLFNNWGISCTQDAIHAAKYLIGHGYADPKRTAIVGGSAGGYTVLAALAFHDFFQAGVSYYGVSDLESLVKETHKFEAHYLDKLVDSSRYKELSPLYHVENINVPLLLLQGAEDAIVPANQSESIYNALKKRGISTTYILFPNEGHGFRSKEALVTSLQAEHNFYTQAFEIHLP